MQEDPIENEDSEDDEHSEEYLENLRMENEIKKIKLSLEHGTDLSSQLSDAGLPPEIEGQFLDYISKFEEEFAKRKKIVVFELAGKPGCRPVADIPDEEISAELEKLMGVLSEHSIAINAICPVEEREMYRFITEELFNVETNDIRIEGMTHGFIYEEFHPNHEHDIKNRCTEFVKQLLDKDRDWAADFLSLADEVAGRGKTWPKDAAVEQLGHFRDAFSAFTLHDFIIESVALNEAKNEGAATCHIQYSGNMEGSVETLEYEGECIFNLKREDEWWEISRIEIPGVAL